MKLTSKVSSKGQVTIPKALRDALGIKTGHTVVISKGENGRYIVYTEKQFSELQPVVFDDSTSTSPVS
jgi:AbrB family looped-hinge helix DNA binding protein